MLHYRESIEPGSEQSCLPAIVKTGNEVNDRLNKAITLASSEDIALLMVALSRAPQAQSETRT